MDDQALPRQVEESGGSRRDRVARRSCKQAYCIVKVPRAVSCACRVCSTLTRPCSVVGIHIGFSESGQPLEGGDLWSQILPLLSGATPPVKGRNVYKGYLTETDARAAWSELSESDPEVHVWGPPP